MAGDKQTQQPETQGQLTFEQALARLEHVVRELESGERSLDEALGLFQEGIALARQCQQRLDEAEARIEKLLDLRDGRPVLEPVAEPGDAGATGRGPGGRA